VLIICQTESVIYKADVKLEDGSIHSYIGLTETPSKRYGTTTAKASKTRDMKHRRNYPNSSGSSRMMTPSTPLPGGYSPSAKHTNQDQDLATYVQQKSYLFCRTPLPSTADQNLFQNAGMRESS